MSLKRLSVQSSRNFYRLLQRLVLSHSIRDQLFATLWTVTPQVPLSLGVSRQEYWSGLHALAQVIFLTQASNPHLLWLLHHRQILYVYVSNMNEEADATGIQVCT